MALGKNDARFGCVAASIMLKPRIFASILFSILVLGVLFSSSTALSSVISAENLLKVGSNDRVKRDVIETETRPSDKPAENDESGDKIETSIVSYVNHLLSIIKYVITSNE